MWDSGLQAIGVPGLQVNYNLLAVNVAMACTGIAQLTRKLRHDYGMDSGPGEPQLALEK